MLKVKTKIKPSIIHGKGLFAGEFISKGTVTWEYDPDFDTGYTKRQIDSLPDSQRSYMMHFCYFDKKIKKFILCCDNQKFINHFPVKENVLSTPRKDTALRDIYPGEELLCDYRKFDKDYFGRVGINTTDIKGHLALPCLSRSHKSPSG